MPCGAPRNQATGDWLLFTDADVLFKPDVLRRAVAYAEAEAADHLVLFPRMIMKRPGEKNDDRFFPNVIRFRTSSLEGCRSQDERSHRSRGIQPGSPAGLRSDWEPTRRCASKCSTT